MGLTGIAKLSRGPSRRVRRRVAAYLPEGGASVRTGRIGRSRAVSACEVVECAVLIATLGTRGIAVSVVGDRVVFAGDVHAPVRRRSEGVFIETAMDTLEGRAGAVAEAIARGPAFGARIAEERRAASAAIRRGRKPRARRAKKILSVPAAAAVWLTAESEPLLTPSACPPPPAPTFTQEPEP